VVARPRRSLAGIAVSNPDGEWMSVSRECCVFIKQRCQCWADHSSRGVLPRLVYLMECNHEASKNRRPWPNSGCGVTEKKCFNAHSN
jgi:hypothetical protein